MFTEFREREFGDLTVRPLPRPSPPPCPLLRPLSSSCCPSFSRPLCTRRTTPCLWLEQGAGPSGTSRMGWGGGPALPSPTSWRRCHLDHELPPGSDVPWFPKSVLAGNETHPLCLRCCQAGRGSAVLSVSGLIRVVCTLI